MLDIIKAHAVKNLCYIAGRKMVPKGIVVHSTGANNPNLNRYVDAPEEVGNNRYGNHWNIAMPEGRKVCVHAFIGYDKNRQIRVAEILPLDICCWGVGNGDKGSYNYNPAYIQFEICEDDLADGNYYKNAFAVAAEYCAKLCRTYGIDVDKIVGHYEAHRLGYGCDHSDPEYWMKKYGQTMDDFRQMVSKILGNSADEPKKDANQKTAVENVSIDKGDLVSIAKDAKYYNGGAVPSWVKAQNWYVKSKPNGDRVVIDQNEKKTNSICSPINRKYLTVVRKAKGEINPNEVKQKSCLVKIMTDRLNIRKGAGTNTATVGAITDRGVYTIVEEKNGVGATKWGKLKSGAGWISLDYTKKL